MSQELYFEKVLHRFNICKTKVVSSPLTINFKLTDRDIPFLKKDVEEIDRVSYASTVESLMYAMVFKNLDLQLVLLIGFHQIRVRSIGKQLNGFLVI